MEWDADALKLWLDGLQFFLTTLVAAVVWALNRDRVRADALRRLEDDTDSRLDAVNERLTRIESRVEHLPGTMHIERLHERIDAVHQDLSALRAASTGLTEAIQSLQRTVGLLLEHHVDRSR